MGHASGVYMISARNGSGLPNQSVYCDMDEDGGGWMLLYSYNRNVRSRNISRDADPCRKYRNNLCCVDSL